LHFVKSGRFGLPSQRQLHHGGLERKILVLDVTEVEVERPKKSECVIPRIPRNERRAQDHKNAIRVANTNAILSKDKF
jgi:hypothetical protein